MCCVSMLNCSLKNEAVSEQVSRTKVIKLMAFYKLNAAETEKADSSWNRLSQNKIRQNVLVHAVFFKFLAKSTAVNTHHSCCASLVTASILHDGI